MKTIFARYVLLLGTFCATELHVAAREELAEKDSVTVSINTSAVSINGQKLNFNRASERTFDKLLDSKASKQRTSSCFVYLWDDAGLRVYGAWGFQRGIDSCDLVFLKIDDKDEIAPESAFSGKLTVNEVSVTANTTENELVKALGQDLKPLPEHSFRLSLKKHDVFFYFSGVDTNALQSVQIRRKSAVGRLIHSSE